MAQETTGQSAEAPALKLVTGRDSKGASLKDLTGYSTTVIKKVFAEAKPVVLTGTEEGETLGSASVVAQNIRSIMAVPLKIKNKIFGVVYLDSRLTKGLFTEDDLDFFNAISNQIAVSIQLAHANQVEREKAQLQKELEIQAAVAELARRVQNLVDNMRQALFSIDSTQTIVEPVSKISSTVFSENISGKSALETLYRSIPRDSDTFANINTAISAVFGEDELQWSLMEDLFPNKVPYKNGETEQIFRVSVRPLYNELGQVEKIMFVVEDITDLERLESAIRDQNEKIQVLQQVAEVDHSELENYLEASQKLLDRCSEVLPSLDNNEQYDALLRTLHTLKGNSRLYNLTSMASSIHETEEAIISARTAQMPTANLIELIRNRLITAVKLLSNYSEVAQKYLGIGNKNKDGQMLDVPLDNVAMLEKMLERLKGKIPAADYKRVTSLIKNLTTPALKTFLLRFSNMVRDISGRLGKKVDFEVLGGEFQVPKETFQNLSDALVHLIRNAIDHGLELPSERLKAGKTENGRISIQASNSDSSLLLEVSDDGNGIDHDRVAASAVRKGLIKEQTAQKMTVQEKVNLIMLPGFSTKDEASEISGRGVGMDAVKEIVESVDGTFEIATVLKKGTKFIMKIPFKS
jgi:two-component system chemotaxis sensor kinase CheA